MSLKISSACLAITPVKLAQTPILRSSFPIHAPPSHFSFKNGLVVITCPGWVDTLALPVGQGSSINVSSRLQLVFVPLEPGLLPFFTRSHRSSRPVVSDCGGEETYQAWRVVLVKNQGRKCASAFDGSLKPQGRHPRGRAPLIGIGIRRDPCAMPLAWGSYPDRGNSSCSDDTGYPSRLHDLFDITEIPSQEEGHIVETPLIPLFSYISP